jgi:hypothetical protein
MCWRSIVSIHQAFPLQSAFPDAAAKSFGQSRNRLGFFRKNSRIFGEDFAVRDRRFMQLKSNSYFNRNRHFRKARIKQKA